MSKRKAHKLTASKAPQERGAPARFEGLIRTPVKLGCVMVGTLLHLADEKDKRVAFVHDFDGDGFFIQRDAKHFPTLKEFAHWFKAETGVSLRRVRAELVKTGHFI
jgi:hypothetical protein